MAEDYDEYDDETELDDGSEVSDAYEDLERRVEELEENSSGGTDFTLPYSMGMMLAMILSWARNHSILMCMLHGFLSWAYVIYFAVTR